MVADAEAVRLNPASTKAQITAQKDLLERIDLLSRPARLGATAATEQVITTRHEDGTTPIPEFYGSIITLIDSRASIAR